MDDFCRPHPATAPTAARPLLGLTVLVVEDSRYASDALRLMCLKSGARIRRADSLRAARRHLRAYRPSVAIIDLGLPDGSGLDLIRDLTQPSSAGMTVLAFSGEETAEKPALAAGANGFLAKPVVSLPAFQAAILCHLPAERRPPPLRSISDTKVTPDPMTFADDLCHAAKVLQKSQNDANLRYAAQFLSSLAQSAGDGALKSEAEDLMAQRRAGKPISPGLTRLSALLQQRLQAQPQF
ncbi:response regulator [Cognatishimia sp. SS12]|uniref:response regulator n=1 Tax=Cognatishimia sp. SS12 TaxID=2979465 RepID=UPI00232FF389|nr:response regulator [Cognatishimia sp. SS12]MDC0738166.1 response regulator [Cognatishimia sp. SS12]